MLDALFQLGFVDDETACGGQAHVRDRDDDTLPLDHPLKRKYVMEVDAPRMARRIGLELKMPANFPEHALPPSRAFYWIEQQDPAKAVAFAKAAYRMYWLEGLATSDAAVAGDTAEISVPPIRGASHQNSI